MRHRPTRSSPPTRRSTTSPATDCRTSAARSAWRAPPAPHTGNAQFYINLVDNPELDPLPTRWGYAVFGQVVEGMDVVDRIGVVADGQPSAPSRRMRR